MSSILSAGLLKWNFQRSPTHRLREQRMQIMRLVRQIESVQASVPTDRLSDSTSAPVRSGAGPSPETAPASRPIVNESRHRAAWSRLVSAEQQWRDLLQRHDLPTDVSAPRLVALVRNRIPVDRDGLSSAVHHQLAGEAAEDEAWLRQWWDRTAEVLREPVEQTEASSPQQILERLAALRLRLLQARLETQERTAQRQIRREMQTLQRQLKRLTQRRRQILNRTGS